MPVFNVESYIEDALDSVLSQTFTDFELIVVNDGSVDKTLDKINAYLLKDCRIMCISQRNMGLSVARNTGIKHSSGDYLYFMDGDDIIETNLLESVFNIIKNKNSPDMIAFPANSFIDKPGTSFRDNMNDIEINPYYQRTYIKPGLYSDPWEYYKLMHEKNNFVASACLYVTSGTVIRDNNLKFKPGILHEDELFTRQLISYIKSVYFTKDTLYLRRYRDNSIMKSEVSDLKISSLIDVSNGIYVLFLIVKIPGLRQDATFFFTQALKYMEYLNTKKLNLILKLVFSFAFIRFTGKKRIIRLLLRSL